MTKWALFQLYSSSNIQNSTNIRSYNTRVKHMISSIYVRKLIKLRHLWFLKISANLELCYILLVIIMNIYQKTYQTIFNSEILNASFLKSGMRLQLLAHFIFNIVLDVLCNRISPSLKKNQQNSNNWKEKSNYSMIK